MHAVRREVVLTVWANNPVKEVCDRLEPFMNGVHVINMRRIQAISSYMIRRTYPSKQCKELHLVQVLVKGLEVVDALLQPG